MSDPAPIMASTQAAQRQKQEKARPAAPDFSYALAAATLEKNASQSLKAHGARPAGDDPSSPRPAAPDGEHAEGAPRPEAARSAEGGTPRAIEDAAEPATPFRAEQNAAKPAGAAQAAIAIIRPAVAAAPAAQAASSAETGAVRDAAAKLRTVAAKMARAPAQPASLKAEFAEILARRLEKTTVFDLRLDPPELGRVEGRLAINDDGKSVLSLTFDSKDAFDLFSRDADALYRALEQAGLDFAAGDFIFEFRARADGESDIRPLAETTAETSSAYDPAFIASWSAGALDIRI